MARTLAIFAVCLALVSFGFGVRARFLALKNPTSLTYSFAPGLLIALAVILGALPAALRLGNAMISIMASTISLALSAIAILLLSRRRRA